MLIHDAGVQTIASRFTETGTPIHVVGGAVRDRLLGREAKDIDLCTPATPEKIRAALAPLGTVYDQGARFGTIGVHIAGMGDYEVTTYRQETYDDGSRNPEVRFHTSLTDDLARRDLTINAIAWDPVTGEIVDPFEGTVDLANRVLRAPGDPVTRFTEDPLRIARLARFAVTYRFAVDTTTAEAAARTSDKLGGIARERRHDELARMLSYPRDGAFQDMLRMSADLHLDRHLFGQLDVRTARTEFTDDPGPTARLAALCWATRQTDPSRELNALKFPKDTIRSTTRIANAAVDLTDATHVSAARRVARNYTDPEIDDASRMLTAAGRKVPRAFARLSNAERAHSRSPLPVDGNDLTAAGLSGPAVGDALRRIEDAWLTRSIATRDEAIALVLG